ncbi:restriction system modified-DNA reader domain-containing protein [Micromonospora zhanjiangensis]|uniref:RAMA domain-containing protein n=1 Tax=Micromonospora zhanjiangensis TaxID=1522057 RepID=A0ABV8KRP6_9ACTN
MARRTIEVDDEVFTFLQQHCEPLVDTPNDVLRRLLLSGDSEESPKKSAPTVRRLPRRPGALLPLINAGVLTPGDVLRHEQPRRRMVHEATVTPQGWLELADGRSFSTPSRALAEQTGTTINGWFYVHVPSGEPLHKLRRQVEQS